METVVLNAGHGTHGDPGCVFGGRSEAAEVAWQAGLVKSQLVGLGIDCKVIDNTRDPTHREIGRQAAGAAAFVALHLNASIRHGARGHEVLVLPAAQAGPKDLALANRILSYLDQTLAGEPNRGVKTMGLGVLLYAPPLVPKCLVESTFLDHPDYSRELLAAAALGIAKAICSFVHRAQT